MIAYIIRRLLLLPIVLIGLSFLLFAMMQLLSPRDRLGTYVRDPAQLKQGQEVLKQLMEKYGLNDPIWVQYGRWLRNVFHGNLGYSESANMEVMQALKRFLPATAQLALFAVIPVIFGGIWLGVLSAVHHNGIIDHTTRIIALTGWSLPTFVMGLLLLMLFYRWFPPGELSIWAARIVDSPQFVRYTGMNAIDAILNGNLAVLGDALRHLVLPVFTLAYIQWALLLRVMRSSMLETLRQDYITTARAKGLKEKVVIKKHARANALLPVITIAGVMVAGLLRGVVITETIFNYHGLGLFAVQAAQQLDFPAIIGFALFTGILMIMANLIVDLLYAYIDPRVKLG